MKRQEKCEARRKAILEAALTEFLHKGVARARIEDIARSAGVGKGTVYLYFADKASIYDGLIFDLAGMIVPRAHAIAQDATLSLREKLELLYDPMLENNGDSFLARMIRLGCAEGTYSAQETYYRNIVEPLMEILRGMLDKECENLPDSRLVACPQLFAAPLVQGLIWQGLFGEISSLDLRSVFTVWLDIVLGHKKESC